MRLADTSTPIKAVYSPLVRDRVRIRQRQLVAIDVAATPPQISWRWFIGEVEATGPEGVSVRRLDQPPGASRLLPTPGPGTQTSVGGEVYFGPAERWEVVDTVSGDFPTNPGRVAERYFGYIEGKLGE